MRLPPGSVRICIEGIMLTKILDIKLRTYVLLKLLDVCKREHS